ncbi:MAG TPA: antibiotic biosynthesis monooxygenase [Caldimonas sp.]|nr:antibiotic biosynthesis monooxygenase [Caldimonas sp.]
MILEIADIRIQTGRHAEFEAAIRRGAETVIAQAKGHVSHRVVKGIESPDRYVLMIWWQTLEDHTEGFRSSPLFAQWRSIVGPFFAQPPSVEHFSTVMQSQADA